ncbi:MAG TPA: hypothetical protein DFS52_11725 [Myxococcales bacterium]|nr:hypothetical protein [Myxococcales bacterium]
MGRIKSPLRHHQVFIPMCVKKVSMKFALDFWQFERYPHAHGRTADYNSLPDRFELTELIGLQQNAIKTRAVAAEAHAID